MTTTTVPTHDPAREHVAPGTPPPAERANGPRLPLWGRRAHHVNPKKLIGYPVLIVFATIYLYPFAIQIATLFKSDPEATAHPLSLVPNPFDLGAWKRMFRLTSDTSVPIMTWLGNSVLVTVIITASRVFFDGLAGYALSRLHFRGRGVMFMALLAVMSVPGVVLLVPKFLIVTYLGIFDTYTAMILPLMVDAAGIFISEAVL
jgi:multiple sugar transport system permease protein